MAKIMIVDDNVELMKLIERGLRFGGHVTIKASSGEEALEYLRSSGPEMDLILSDYIMPRMNGLELLEKIKKIRPHLPVIIMTAYSEKRMVIEAIRGDCSGFIEKPFSFDELMAEIARIFSQQRRII